MIGKYLIQIKKYKCHTVESDSVINYRKRNSLWYVTVWR